MWVTVSLIRGETIRIQRVFEVGDEGFVYHVVDDFAWGVEGAGLFAGSCAGFGVIGSEQVFEDLSEEFGIQGDFLLYRCILGNREFVAVEDVD